jgi:hypothetical protein
MKVEWIESERREPIYEMVKQRRGIKPEIIEYGNRAEEREQLAKVREELAGIPNTTLVLAVEKADEPKPEPKSLGEMAVKWLMEGIGLLLIASGKAGESVSKEAVRRS